MASTESIVHNLGVSLYGDVSRDPKQQQVPEWHTILSYCDRLWGDEVTGTVYDLDNSAVAVDFLLSLPKGELVASWDGSAEHSAGYGELRVGEYHGTKFVAFSAGGSPGLSAMNSWVLPDNIVPGHVRVAWEEEVGR